MLDSIIGVLIVVLIVTLFSFASEGHFPMWVASGITGFTVIIYGIFVKAWTVKMMVRYLDR